MSTFRGAAKVQRGVGARLPVAPRRAIAVCVACVCAFAGAFAVGRFASPPRGAAETGAGAPIAGEAMAISLELPAAAPIPVGVVVPARPPAKREAARTVAPAQLSAPAPTGATPPQAPASAPATAPSPSQSPSAPAASRSTPAKPAPSGASEPAEAGKSFDSSG